ncbi:MAG: hypothetical protein O2931_17310 [Planctomycetota bacterium]|nr:hypothetical protein [Planctomycetota bacterium]MDA1180540.1 hypothetical protein [Planctomycetota bacterium]
MGRKVCPEEVATKADDGIPYIALKTLLELKLANGMTAPHRPRDLDDAIQLIRCNQLQLDYAESLNPFAAEKFCDLWSPARSGNRLRFGRTNKVDNRASVEAPGSGIG